MNKKLKTKTIFLFFIISVFLITFVYGQISNSLSRIACTNDVLQCTDGSFVTRNPNNNCNFYPCPNEQATTSCTDSDGLDYQKKGFTTWYVNNEKITYEDMCVLQTTNINYEKKDSCSGKNCFLVENFCSDNTAKTKIISCEDGCSEGFCSSKIPEEPTCQTIKSEMIIDYDGTGYIYCNVSVSGNFNIEKSYCMSEKGKISYLRKTSTNNLYYTILYNLDPTEEVNAFIVTNTGKTILCLPTLNQNKLHLEGVEVEVLNSKQDVIVNESLFIHVYFINDGESNIILQKLQEFVPMIVGQSLYKVKDFQGIWTDINGNELNYKNYPYGIPKGVKVKYTLKGYFTQSGNNIILAYSKGSKVSKNIEVKESNNQYLNNYFRKITFICQNGVSYSQGSFSCKSSSEWLKIANSICKEKCKEDTCGVASYYFDYECKEEKKDNIIFKIKTDKEFYNYGETVNILGILEGSKYFEVKTYVQTSEEIYELPVNKNCEKTCIENQCNIICYYNSNYIIGNKYPLAEISKEEFKNKYLSSQITGLVVMPSNNYNVYSEAKDISNNIYQASTSFSVYLKEEDILLNLNLIEDENTLSLNVYNPNNIEVIANIEDIKIYKYINGVEYELAKNCENTAFKTQFRLYPKENTRFYVWDKYFYITKDSNCEKVLADNGLYKIEVIYNLQQLTQTKKISKIFEIKKSSSNSNNNNCELKCAAIGTEKEGWYDSCTGILVKYEKCSNCDGCYVKNKCLPYGARIKEEGIAYYCSFDNKLELQKQNEERCINNFECLSNTCLNELCIDVSKEINETKSLVQTIIDFLQKIFGRK
ncbi:MAG: hypothetical protein QXE31_03300 [Candidatus Woesearchaeota archaeon]